MESTDNKKVILVLGMHRSGTSAVTAGLQKALEVPLGPVQTGPVPDNLKGCYENSSTWQINDSLLERLGSSWDSYAVLYPMDWDSPAVLPYLTKAVDLIRNTFGDQRLWGMKDPRITVLLPFWENVFREVGADVYRILSLRHPFEVALSLRSRFRQLPNYCFWADEDLRYSLNLWYWYNINVLQNIRDDRNVVISFDDLLANPDAQMNRIAHFVDIEACPERIHQYASDFLDAGLKHHASGLEEIEPLRNEYSYVLELYARLKSFAVHPQFSKCMAENILKGLPDSTLLQSWAVPVFHRCQMIRAVLKGMQRHMDAPEQPETATRMLPGNPPVCLSSDRPLPSEEQRCREQKRFVPSHSQLQQLKDQLNQQGPVPEPQRNLLQKINEMISELENDNRELQSKNVLLGRIVDQKDQELSEARASFREHRDLFLGLENQLKRSKKECEDLKNLLEEHERVICRLKQDEALKGQMLKAKEEGLEKARMDLEILRKLLFDKNQEIEGYREKLYQVYTSRSWRYTHLFRRTEAMGQRLTTVGHGPLFRGVIKSLYWKLPLALRRSRLLENAKDRYKDRELSIHQ